MAVFGVGAALGNEGQEIEEFLFSARAECGGVIEGEVEQACGQCASAGAGHVALKEGGHGAAVLFGGEEDAVREVACQDFVGALAGEDDLHVAAGELGEQEHGDDDGIADGFVEVPDEFGQQRHVGGFADDLVVVAPVAASDFARGGQFVPFRIEADGEGAHGLVREAAHGADDGAGIETTAEERADGHVADHAQAHKLVEVGGKLFGAGVFIADGLVVRARFPVAFEAEGAALPEGPMGGGEFADAGEEGFGAGDQRRER